MAWTERYANFDLTTGDNNGTSEANAWRTPADVIANVAAGNRVNIKRQASAYNLTSTVAFNVNGTATAPIYYRAYASTIGDGGIWDVVYNSGGVANLTFTGNHNFVEGVKFFPGATVNLHSCSVSGAGSYAVRCELHNRNSSPSYSNIHLCHIGLVGNISAGVAGTNLYPATWRRSLIARTGASTSTQLVSNDQFGRAFVLEDSILTCAGKHGGVFLDRQNSGRAVRIMRNRFYNLSSGIIIDEEPDADAELVIIADNVFSTMGTYAVKRTNTEGGFVRIYGNYYHSCTSGFTDYSDEAQIFGNMALTASPFTDPANGDFSLNAEAGGGVILRAVSDTLGGELQAYPYRSFATEEATGGGASSLLLARRMGALL